MDTTRERFSLSRIFRDFGRILKSRWSGWLLILLLVALLQRGVGELWMRVGDALFPGQTLATMSAASIVQRLTGVATEALAAGFVLAVALDDQTGSPTDRLARALRKAAVRYPAVALPFLLSALPIIANIVLTNLSLAGDPAGADMNRVAFASTCAGVVSLMVFAFVGLAPAAAVGENLPAGAALRRSFSLVAGRSFLFFVLYGAVVLALFLVPLTLGMAAPNAPLVQYGWVWTAVAAVIQFIGLAAVYLEAQRLNETAPEAGAVQSQPLSSP